MIFLRIPIDNSDMTILTARGRLPIFLAKLHRDLKEVRLLPILIPVIRFEYSIAAWSLFCLTALSYN